MRMRGPCAEASHPRKSVITHGLEASRKGRTGGPIKFTNV
jgi:hypothetical protein